MRQWDRALRSTHLKLAQRVGLHTLVCCFPALLGVIESSDSWGGSIRRGSIRFGAHGNVSTS